METSTHPRRNHIVRTPITINPSPTGASASADTRAIAEVLYTTSSASLVELQEHPALQVRGVHLRTLESWCSTYGWKKKREDFRQNWIARLRDEIGVEIASHTKADIDRLQAVKCKLFSRIGNLKPRTLEGAIAALCRLTELTNTLQRMVPDDRETPGYERPQLLAPELTEEEARAAALAVLAVKRKNQERELQNNQEQIEEHQKRHALP